MQTPNLPASRPRRPAWNKGRIVGQKRPLLPKQVWAIRVRLEIVERHRNLALFNTAIDSKLRGCGLVCLKVADVYAAGQIRERASILQSKTRKPVRIELTEGDYAPEAWRKVMKGKIERRQVWSQQVRSKQKQVLVAGSDDERILDEVAALTPSEFEAFTKDASSEELMVLVERIDIAQGTLMLKLSVASIAERLAIEPDLVDAGKFVSVHTCERRKRGVETKIILADAPAGRDETLIRNIARAHVWFEAVKVGQTFDQIAEATGTSKRRVQDMIGLAFLAPDKVGDILDGKQPVGFTSDWCKSHKLPSDWSDQRALLATL